MKKSTADIRYFPSAHVGKGDEFRIQSGDVGNFDPVEMAGILPQTTIAHTLLDSGHFKGSWLRAKLGCCQLGTAAFNRRLLATGRMPLSFGVLLDAAGTSRLNCNEVQPGDSVVFGEDSDAYFQLAPRAHWCFLQVPREALGSLGDRIEPSAVRRLGLTPALRHELGRAARCTIEMVGRIQACVFEVGTHPTLTRDLQDSLLDAFVRCFARSQSTATVSRQADAICAERYALVREAESLMMALSEEPLSITEICARLGTSVRRLELAFDYVHGTSPKNFQKMRRLSVLRHGLLCRTADLSSVTDIALDCGFTHLGRLSSTYKVIFGELPSATLARTRASIATGKNVGNTSASYRARAA